MKYEVNLSASAEEDLFEIYQFIYFNDSEDAAEKLFQRINEKCLSLCKFPLRGHIPPELKMLNIDDFLEITLGPYRIIYQVINKNVFIYCILDGRRDMQKILHERLVRD